ncbi:MAG: MFS transporter [Sphingobium limneticum]
MAEAGKRRNMIGDAIRVSSGNFLEMYDFMVFGYYASAIGKAFFPSASPLNALLLALMTFGAGFLMRPLGAIVLGIYTDRIGRRKGLILTLALMSIGTLLLALVPGYGQIGLLAPVLVLCGRLLQGFSAGVELGSVSVYLAEMASPKTKGFWVSWQSASQQLAVMFAAFLGVLLNRFLSVSQVDAWGWRIPLLIGLSLVPMLFVLRRSLRETDEFAARTAHPTASEIGRTLAQNAGVIVTGMAMVMMTTICFYLITAYTPTFGKEVLHLDPTATMIVTMCVGASNLFWLPLSGALSDRIGRKPILLATSVLAIASAYPVMLWLTSAPSFGRLLAAELWLSFIFGTYNGANVVYLTEIVPPRVRASGFSLAYSLATCIGGFTPAICTWLIERTHNKAMPGVWLSIAATIALGAILISKPYAERTP